MEIYCSHCRCHFYDKWPDDERLPCPSCGKLVDGILSVDGERINAFIKYRASLVDSASFEVPEHWCRRPLITQIVVILGAIPLTIFALVVVIIAWFFSFIDPNGPARQAQVIDDIWHWAGKGGVDGTRLVRVALKELKSNPNQDGVDILKACVRGVGEFAFLSSGQNASVESSILDNLEGLRSLKGVPEEPQQTLEDMTFAIVWARPLFTEVVSTSGRGELLETLAKDTEGQIQFAEILVMMSPLKSRVHPMMEETAKYVEEKAPKLAAIFRRLRTGVEPACPDCDQKIFRLKDPGNTIKCTKCGARLKFETFAKVVLLESGVPREEAADPPNERSCPQCSSLVPNYRVTCKGCGYELGRV